MSTKNYYINYVIKKNDLALKYDYFKTIEKNNKKKEKEALKVEDGNMNSDEENAE